MSWSEAFRTVLLGLEDGVENAIGMTRSPERPIVVPYTGYGTAERVWVRGRVIGDTRISSTDQVGSPLTNLRENWMRFFSREVPGADVEIRVGGVSTTAVTGPEGYFDLEIELPKDVTAGEWIPYEAVLISPPTDSPPVTGRILMPPPESRLGVISDIDDTVIETGATSRLRMLRTVLLGNARVRVPFEGIASLLRDLQRSRSAAMSPLFYVSSGPWNLYDFIQEFFAIHEVPPGPILLQDYGFDDNKLIHAPHDEHKLAEIRKIMKTFPGLSWILIGDSGQQDPEIYSTLAREQPEQIAGIVIRDVTGPERDEEVREILDSLERLSVPYKVVDTAQMGRDFLGGLGLMSDRVCIRDE